MKALFNRVEAYNNGYAGIFLSGFFADAGAVLKATVADSVSANNGTYGIVSSTRSGHGTTVVMVVRSVVANNSVGILADATFMQIAQSTVTGHGYSWSAINGAFLESFGDNYIVGNSDGNPAIPNLTPKK